MTCRDSYTQHMLTYTYTNMHEYRQTNNTDRQNIFSTQINIFQNEMCYLTN